MNELYKAANKDKEAQTELLSLMCEKLDKLAELKETQIENQVKFEKKWRMAKLGAMLAMAAAIATDVVKLSEDGQVIMDRAGVVVQKVIDMVKTIGD
jgi:hypothetical protein